MSCPEENNESYLMTYNIRQNRLLLVSDEGIGLSLESIREEPFTGIISYGCLNLETDEFTQHEITDVNPIQ